MLYHAEIWPDFDLVLEKPTPCITSEYSSACEVFSDFLMKFGFYSETSDEPCWVGGWGEGAKLCPLPDFRDSSKGTTGIDANFSGP